MKFRAYFVGFFHEHLAESFFREIRDEASFDRTLMKLAIVKDHRQDAFGSTRSRRGSRSVSRAQIYRSGNKVDRTGGVGAFDRRGQVGIGNDFPLNAAPRRKN